MRRVRHLGWRRAVVATLLGIVSVVAAIGFTIASNAHPVDHIGLGLSDGSAAPDGTTRLELYVDNGTSSPMSAVLRVEAANPASAPGLQPVDANVNAAARAAGNVDVVLKNGCGVRLTITLRTDREDRSLTVFVPCVGASAAPS